MTEERQERMKRTSPMNRRISHDIRARIQEAQGFLPIILDIEERGPKARLFFVQAMEKVGQGKGEFIPHDFFIVVKGEGEAGDEMDVIPVEGISFVDEWEIRLIPRAGEDRRAV